MAIPSRKFVTDNALLLLIAWRLLNALTLRTFFQPDEYYQALEPAWWMSFGQDSHAWITWEWHNNLRSAFHPALFAALYKVLDTLSTLLGLSSGLRTELLVAGPKCLQACIAAVADYYTFKLSAQIHGPSSDAAWYTLLLTAGSAWNWFVSTRTFSNCLETALTVIALYHWPSHWALGVHQTAFEMSPQMLRIRHNPDKRSSDTAATTVDEDELRRLRTCLLAASLAAILRPTNAVIWLFLLGVTFARALWNHAIHWEMHVFLYQVVTCVPVVLAVTAIVDRLFYGAWTLPLWHFFRINVLHSLAVFYGNNNWHYYLSQGYPLLLTGALPFALLGLRDALKSRNQSHIHVQCRIILRRLAQVSILLPLALSVLSHKEVRFIYPVLPALHVLAASRLALNSQGQGNGQNPEATPTKSQGLSAKLIIVFAINATIGGYVSYVHNSGIMSIAPYLRSEFETNYIDSSDTTAMFDLAGKNLTFAVLMPCHSIPWRSHIQYPPTETSPGISGWALTCEPPLDLNVTQKTTYLDEADIFYENPVAWLRRNMAHTMPLGVKKPGVYAAEQNKNHYSSRNRSKGVWLHEGEGGKPLKPKQIVERAWPDYLIFFQQLEPIMSAYLDNTGYAECSRFFNSHFHDDWRRTGDIVVWCLHTEKHDRPASVSGKNQP